MLKDFYNYSAECMPISRANEPTPEQRRWERNFKEDLGTGIEKLFKFKEEIEKLHPTVFTIIEKLLR